MNAIPGRRPHGFSPGLPSAPAEAARYGVHSFLYQEEAVVAAAALLGWQTHVQYVAEWDCWVIAARRKSWPIDREAMLQTDGKVA